MKIRYNILAALQLCVFLTLASGSLLQSSSEQQLQESAEQQQPWRSAMLRIMRNQAKRAVGSQFGSQETFNDWNLVNWNRFKNGRGWQNGRHKKIFGLPPNRQTGLLGDDMFNATVGLSTTPSPVMPLWAQPLWLLAKPPLDKISLEVLQWFRAVDAASRNPAQELVPKFTWMGGEQGFTCGIALQQIPMQGYAGGQNRGLVNSGILGKGRFGVVHLVPGRVEEAALYDPTIGMTVNFSAPLALKSVDVQLGLMNAGEWVLDACKTAYMQHLLGDLVPRLYGAWIDDGLREGHILMERMDRSIDDYALELKGKRIPLRWQRAFLGLHEKMIDQGWMLKDPHFGNAMLDMTGRLRLIDFGDAVRLNPEDGAKLPLITIRGQNEFTEKANIPVRAPKAVHDPDGWMEKNAHKQQAIYTVALWGSRMMELKRIAFEILETQVDEVPDFFRRIVDKIESGDYVFGQSMEYANQILREPRSALPPPGTHETVVE